MQRYSSNKPRPQQQGQQGQPPQETFSQMASVTAEKSGVAGKLLVISLIIVSIAITAFVGYAIIKGVDDNSETTGVDSQNLVEADHYQAVFLSDGQIYFGKLKDIDREWVVLSRIFYLQVEQQVQPDRSGDDKEAAQPRISLAKLGNELHGPSDEMYIRRDNILFWENLKVARTDDESDEGSRVVRAINDYCNKDENKARCGL